MLDPQPDDATLDAIYGEMYFIGSGVDALREQAAALKRATARLQLAEISAYLGATTGKARPRMLEIGCGLGNFLIEAREAGFDVHGIDVSANAVVAANAALGEERARAGRLEEAGFAAAGFDVVVLADVIEHVRDPKAFMVHVRGLVKPGGVVFVATPSLDSLSARLMGRHWVEFKLEHLFYFNRRTVARLLGDCGFECVTLRPGWKVLNLGYIIGHFEHYPVPLLTPVMKMMGRILPDGLLRRPVRIVASGLNVLARVPAAAGPR